MSIIKELLEAESKQITRRHFLQNGSMGLGAAALAGLLGCNMPSVGVKKLQKQVAHFSPKAKRVIFLHMAGAPSQ